MKIRPYLRYHLKDRFRLLKQNYLLHNLKDKAPVLVFTMAKVGSLSVYTSLLKQPKTTTFHIHTLSEDEVLANNKLCFEKGIFPGSRSPVFLINKEVIGRRPFKVISLFRNPIERNLSAFFDSFFLHLGVHPEQYKGSLENLQSVFREKISTTYALDWYDKQFREGLGIDVYSTPFDTEKKYLFYQEEGVEILLLDSTLADIEKEKHIGTFIRHAEFKLVNTNITSQGRGSALYEAFTKSISFSDEELAHYMNAKYTKHFFSAQERARLIERWSV